MNTDRDDVIIRHYPNGLASMMTLSPITLAEWHDPERDATLTVPLWMWLDVMQLRAVDIYQRVRELHGDHFDGVIQCDQ
jgi:hypothetical protein